MATASSVTSVGTYLANGSFDEVTYSPSNLTDSKNLFTNSQDFSAQGYWTPGGSSYSPVATYDVAPVTGINVTFSSPFEEDVTSLILGSGSGPLGTPVAVELLLPDEVITVTVAVYVTPFVRPENFAV
jgi:hypothetical protein